MYLQFTAAAFADREVVISCCDWSREQGARWSPSIIDGASSGGDVSLSDSFSQFIALAFRHLCWSRVWVCARRVTSPRDGVDIAGTLALCTCVTTVRSGCLCRSWVWVYGKDSGDIAGTLTLCVADRMLKSIYQLTLCLVDHLGET